MTTYSGSALSASIVTDRDTRKLVAMADPDLGEAVEPCVGLPDEALRQSIRCLNVECCHIDDLLGKAYSATAPLGWNTQYPGTSNACHSLLSPPATDAAMGELMDFSLQSLGAIAGKCGRVFSLFVQPRRQVWLAQSLLSKPR